jgi:hypothetical protein
MLAVIPPRTTRRTGEDQADWSADLTSENDTRSHPMDGGEPTHNPLLGRSSNEPASTSTVTVRNRLGRSIYLLKF